VKIDRVYPTVTLPPPVEFTMTFGRDDGWAIVMALRDAVRKYTEAVDRDEWNRWANDLDRKLSQDQ
jgi:hypothetical protein